MKILDVFLSDFPQQFQTKKNIEVFITALSSQLQEVYDVLQEVNEKLDIDNAYGVNLDLVGDIVNLSRKDASELARKQELDASMDDEKYRRFLKYKNFMNTCDCSYDNIMSSMSLIWKTEDLHYTERENRPATIYFEIPLKDIDEDDPTKGRILMVKPAGVSVIYASRFLIIVNNRNKINIENISYRIRMPQFGEYILDGKYLMNGAILMDKLLFQSKTNMSIKTKSKNNISISAYCEVNGQIEEL